MTNTKPIILTDYLNYLKSIRGLSPTTIKEYSYDLEVFFEYQIIRKLYYGDKQSFKNDFNPLDTNKVINADFIGSLNITDFYSYLSYLDNEKRW